METFVLEKNGRKIILNYYVTAQEFLTKDRVRLLHGALLNQRICFPPLTAENILRVRFPAIMVPAPSRMQQIITKVATRAIELFVRFIRWLFRLITGLSYKAANVGILAYQHIADGPVPDLVARFPGIFVGSAIALPLWCVALGSCAAKKASRAALIRHFIGIQGFLHLPSSLRATAVLTGVRTNQYITAGIIPGLFTAWAVYDGFYLAAFAYSQYRDHYHMNA